MELLKSLENIYFKRKKDTTKIGVMVKSKQCVEFAQEELVVLLQDPGSLYIGNITTVQ